MKRRYLEGYRLTLIAGLVLAASGCVSISSQDVVQRVNQTTGNFVSTPVALAQTAEEVKQRRERTEELLAAVIGMEQAVQLALVNSPELQMLLAQGWREAADAAQSGRISNPMFAFSRLVSGSEIEYERALSFGLLDVLLLPLRQGVAKYRLENAQLRLASRVIDHIAQVRSAWVKAVAATQNLQYAQQVTQSASASAELAKRMQAAGNFNRLQRAREHLFYAQASSQLALAQHEATATREALGRLLGLDNRQLTVLQLPPRLPAIPAQPQALNDVTQQALEQRLDVRLAQTEWLAAMRAQGIERINSFTDVELSLLSYSKFDTAEDISSSTRGLELGIRLPLFDWGDLKRDSWNARTLAATHQLTATLGSARSTIRETYSAYRTAYDLVRHYRQEVLPLRRVIAEENQLRYNGMIIGVFELMQDARDQVNTVMAALKAEQQFWLAEAALRATTIGQPSMIVLSGGSDAMTNSSAGH